MAGMSDVKDKLRTSPMGALAGIVGGGVTALVVELLEANQMQLLGLPVCIVLLFEVSRVTGRRSSDKEKPSLVS